MSMVVSPDDVFRCGDNLVTREIVGETIVVPISGELANLRDVFTLNATGAFVWQRLDGSATLGAIREQLTEEFEVGDGTAWQDLAELVEALHEAGLVAKVS